MTAPTFRNWLTDQAAAQPPTQFDNGLGVTMTAAALVHRLGSKLTDWESPDDLHALLHGSTELDDLACEALEDVRRPWEALVREFGPPLRPLTAVTPVGEAEEQPGYDGPAYDSADRLHMWMDKSVPAVDRSRLIAEHRDQVLVEAAELLYKADYDLHFISLCCKDCAMESAAGVLLAARTTVGPVSPDEWVRCSGPHCPNGERRRLAAERGWQPGETDTWHCPKCAAARTTAAQEG